MPHTSKHSKTLTHTLKAQQTNVQWYTQVRYAFEDFFGVCIKKEGERERKKAQKKYASEWPDTLCKTSNINVCLDS